MPPLLTGDGGVISFLKGLSMTRKMFRRIFSVLPRPLCELCMKMENMIVYVFYGVLTTLINYIAHFGLRLVFTDLNGVEKSFSAIMAAMENSAVSSAGAATFSWIISVLFAFFTNKFFVFEAKDTSARTIARELAAFAGGRLFSYGCEVLIMFACVDVMKFNELAVKLLCGILVMILNYFLSKLIVFRKRKEENKDM